MNAFLRRVMQVREAEQLEVLRARAHAEEQAETERISGLSKRDLELIAAANEGRGKLTADEVRSLGRKFVRGRLVGAAVEARVVADFNSDQTQRYEKIGRRHGMTGVTVRQILKRNGVVLKSRKFGVGMTPASRAALLADYLRDPSQSYASLSRKYSICNKGVMVVLRNMGVQLQPRRKRSS